MGCFNEIDAVTRLAVLAGEPVIMLLSFNLIHKADRKNHIPRTVTNPLDKQHSLMPAPSYDRIKVFRGEYDDCGGLDGVQELRKLQDHGITVTLRESTMDFVLKEFKSRYKQDKWDRARTKSYAAQFDKRNKRLRDLALKKGKDAVEWGIGQLSHDRFKPNTDFDTLMKACIDFSFGIYLPVDDDRVEVTDEMFEKINRYADDWNNVIFPLLWYCNRCHINIIGSSSMGTQANFFGMSRSLAEFTASEATRILSEDKSRVEYDEL